MQPEFRLSIIHKVEEILSSHVQDVATPPQGMDSDVFIVKMEDGKEYVIKCGSIDINDLQALELIQDSEVDIPVPELFGHFFLEDKIVLILEKFGNPLLETVPNSLLPDYLRSMLNNLKKIHQIKSSKPGLLTEQDDNKSWKEILLYKYSGDHPWFPWKETLKRQGVEVSIVQPAIEKLTDVIHSTDFDLPEFSLLHTDFNQRNLFVDTDNKEISGIVDWGESMFGDPLYDYARVRLFIKHFNLPKSSLREYYDFLQMSEAEKIREQIYFFSHVIDYITWYSEELNAFNSSRLKLHHNILKDWL